jgi:hypothetical protein
VDKVVAGGWSSHEVERQAKYVADNAKQVRERKATDERRTTEAIAMLEKVANRDTATIAVSSYYGSDGVQKGLAADGWRTLTGNAAWQVRAVDNAGECGCKGVWRVEVPYDAKSKVKLGPGCTSDDHARARSAAQDAKWEQQRKKEAAERAAQQQASVATGARVTAFLVSRSFPTSSGRRSGRVRTAATRQRTCFLRRSRTSAVATASTFSERAGSTGATTRRTATSTPSSTPARIPSSSRSPNGRRVTAIRTTSSRTS